MDLTDEDIAVCLKVLQVVADDPSRMDHHNRFKSLVAKIHKQAKKLSQQNRQRECFLADQAVVAAAGIVQKVSLAPGTEPVHGPTKYQRPRPCYICKQLFQERHHFYHALCPSCAERNWAKRGATTHLQGRTALLTGGRIKIGFETGLKLLRDGAKLLVTTRFPEDAIGRYEAQADYPLWRDRLQVFGLDLRDLPSVERFASKLVDAEPHLDIIIHNAAQTVKRPLAFYQRLLTSVSNALMPLMNEPILLEARPGYRGHLVGMESYFSPDDRDEDDQLVDHRPNNSWRLKLGEVPTVELLETLLVSSIAPFVLTSALLPLLQRCPATRRFVINVSAMEGQFHRASKTAYHPHTNMAKAAMNMLTRTSASDLAERGIYMNSVDTGWITDENPLPIATMIREETGFRTPLDCIDGAARIYDPIVRGLQEPSEPLWGHFLKDYEPYPW